MIKKIILFVVLAALCAGGYVYYLWNKPHKTAEAAQATVVAADALVKDFSADEKKANDKYLNKVIEVSGVISEVDKNQDGGLMVVIQTADPMAGVQCAMRDKNAQATKGQTITVKGFCSGSGITGVTLTDCVYK